MVSKIVRQRVTTVLREMGLDKTKQYKYGAGNNPKWGFLVKVNIEQ